MESILFVLSLTVVIYYIMKIVSAWFGKDIVIPTPVLHIFNITFANTYISTPSIMYQVYFWAVHFKFIEGI